MPATVDINVSLAHRLVAAQFPQWASLPMRPVPSAGTQHALYRLGEDMVIRLPQVRLAAGQAAKESRWLPLLAPGLPLAIPVPLVMGRPAAGYPWRWSIYRWLAGETATSRHITDARQAAIDLGQFVAALQRTDPAGGPPSGRGVSLPERDSDTRAAIASLRSIVSADAATAAWEAALSAPSWAAGLVWTHGDLFPSNLLIENGRLSAVIDFGDLGLSDPACDMLGAWSLLPPGVHALFRTALSVDDETWVRGRGWALSIALLALCYFRDTHVQLADVAMTVINGVLNEHREESSYGRN